MNNNNNKQQPQNKYENNKDDNDDIWSPDDISIESEPFDVPYFNPSINMNNNKNELSLRRKSWVRPGTYRKRTLSSSQSIEEPQTTYKSIIKQRLKSIIPILNWLPKYAIHEQLNHDIWAGLTVGIMLISQGMAYAVLANLPPIVGLYTSLLPMFSYALFGTSKHANYGPTALSAILCAEATQFGETDSERIAIASVVSFLVGASHALLSLLRMGMLVSFLSRPVISGFTSAAGVIIGVSQLQHLFGYKIKKSQIVFVSLRDLFENIEKFHWLTFLFGTMCMILLLLIKYINRKYKKLLPGALIVSVLAISVTALFRLDQHGLKIVGDVPQGLPSMSFPSFSNAGSFVSTVTALVLVSFIESIGICKTLAYKHGYHIDSNQELLASGIANILGSLSMSFPVAASFSRSAVLAQVGATSQLANMIVVLVIFITIMVLTRPFYYLPFAMLAALILTSVINLIDIHEAKYLWKVHKRDFACLICAFIATLSLGVSYGIAAAILLSFILIVSFSLRPPISQLGKIPGTDIYRDIKWYDEVKTFPTGIIIRMDAPLYFLNASFLVAHLRKYKSRALKNLKIHHHHHHHQRTTTQTSSPSKVFSNRHEKNKADDDNKSNNTDENSVVKSTLTEIIEVSITGSPTLMSLRPAPTTSSYPNDDAQEKTVELDPMQVELRRSNKLDFVILDARGINDIDSSGIKCLQTLVEDHNREGVLFLISNLSERVWNYMYKCGLTETVFKDRVYFSTDQAVKAGQTWRDMPETILEI